MSDKPIGEVTHYFDKISVAAIKLNAPLKVGDTIKVQGYTTNFDEKVDSMQIDHQEVNEAKKGDEIGIKVSDKVRIGDEIYLS